MENGAAAATAQGFVTREWRLEVRLRETQEATSRTGKKCLYSSVRTIKIFVCGMQWIIDAVQKVSSLFILLFHSAIYVSAFTLLNSSIVSNFLNILLY